MQNIIDNFNTYTSFLPRKLLLGLLAIIFAVTITALALAAAGDDREVKAYKDDNTVSFDKVTFNSFTNVPNYGDEREFTRALVAGRDGEYLTSLDDVKPGDEIVVWAYAHNGINPKFNASGDGIAKDVTVRASVPEGIAASHSVSNFVSASNATPEVVEDAIQISGDTPFELEFVPGSVNVLSTSQDTDLGTAGDAIVDNGILVGDDKQDGEIPGCFEYTVHITYKLKVKTEPKSSFTVNKQVRFDGETSDDWKDTLTAEPGDTIEWLVEFQNTGETDLVDVIVDDTLPAEVTLTDNAVTYFAPDFLDGKQVDSAENLNIGLFQPEIHGFVVIETEVDPNGLVACESKEVINTVTVTPKGQEAQTATASIAIDTGKSCEPETEQSLVCNALSTENPIIAVAGEEIVFTTDAVAENGASITDYSYDFGNGDTRENVTEREAYTYPNAGNFTASVTVNGVVNDQPVEVTSENCSFDVGVQDPKQPEVPVYMCNSLIANPVDGAADTFTLTVEATAEKGAQVLGYVFGFGDGTTEIVETDQTTVTSEAHTYQPGEYTAEVAVVFEVDGEERVEIDEENCQDTVVVDQPVPPQEEAVFECVSLVGTQLNKGLIARFTLTVKAENGATVDEAVIDFGDDRTFKTNDFVGEDAVKTVEFEHEYDKAKDYTATATVTFNVNDDIESVECSDKVEIEEEPEVCEHDNKLTADDPNCKPEEKGKPGVLPDTGPTAAVMGVLGISGFGVAVRSWLGSRRALSNSLLDR